MMQPLSNRPACHLFGCVDKNRITGSDSDAVGTTGVEGTSLKLRSQHVLQCH